MEDGKVVVGDLGLAMLWDSTMCGRHKFELDKCQRNTQRKSSAYTVRVTSQNSKLWQMYETGMPKLHCSCVLTILSSIEEKEQH